MYARYALAIYTCLSSRYLWMNTMTSKLQWSILYCLNAVNPLEIVYSFLLRKLLHLTLWDPFKALCICLFELFCSTQFWDYDEKTVMAEYKTKYCPALSCWWFSVLDMMYALLIWISFLQFFFFFCILRNSLTHSWFKLAMFKKIRVSWSNVNCVLMHICLLIYIFEFLAIWIRQSSRSDKF